MQEPSVLAPFVTMTFVHASALFEANTEKRTAAEQRNAFNFIVNAVFCFYTNYSLLLSERDVVVPLTNIMK